jgi:hypothetical protein
MFDSYLLYDKLYKQNRGSIETVHINEIHLYKHNLMVLITNYHISIFLNEASAIG